MTYALEALINLKTMPEGRRLAPTDAYEQELVGLFKALLIVSKKKNVVFGNVFVFREL